MVWSVTRAIGASAHGAWYGHSVLCLTVSRQLSPRQAVSPIRLIGTAHSAIVVPTHHRQICRSAADAHPRGDRTRHPVRKTPLHVPDRGAHIRQGLSHMLDVPTTPEEVTCSPVSGTTWLPHGPLCSILPLGAVVNRPV